MDSFSFYVVTDTHYFEASLGSQGKAYDERMRTEQKCFRENSEIVHATFQEIAADTEIDTVIIAGDLTQDGEYESHLCFLKELEALKAAGKRVLLITAPHDYNDAPRAYVGDKIIHVKGTEREALRTMYHEYGYAEALAVDESTYSYVAQLCNGVRLLAINIDGIGQVEGSISDAQKEWIAAQVKEADKAGDKVIAMQHFPLIPQQPIFDIVHNCVLDNWADRAAFLADIGVHLIFTGHMHAQSVKRFVSEKGNSIIDVQTSSTIGYPALYRTCTIAGDTVTLKNKDVPDLTMADGTFVDKEYFKKQFVQMIPNQLNIYLKEGEPEQTAVQKALLKIVNSMTFGKATRLLGIRASKELKNMKLTDFAVMLVLPMFEGDPQFKPGTPVYNDISKIFKRLSPVIKKLNQKLAAKGKPDDLTELVLSSLYRKDELCDNECTFKI